MNKRLFFSFSLFAILSFSFLTSCENENNFMLGNKDTAKRREFIVPTINNDTTILRVNSLEDLRHSLTQVVNERENRLIQKGWTKVEEEQPQTGGVSRAKRRIRTDTVYIYRETVDLYSDLYVVLFLIRNHLIQNEGILYIYIKLKKMSTNTNIK